MRRAASRTRGRPTSASPRSARATYWPRTSPPAWRRCEPADLDPGAALLVRLSTVTPERLTWLWEGRLPRGKVVTLDGDPSVGKSTLGVTLAAHITTGKPWPDGSPCERGNVLVLSAEDGLADTIRPRLDAAEGDPDRVDALTAVRTVTDTGEVVQRPPTLADVPAIRGAIWRTRAVLVVVDVLMASCPARWTATGTRTCAP